MESISVWSIVLYANNGFLLLQQFRQTILNPKNEYLPGQNFASFSIRWCKLPRNWRRMELHYHDIVMKKIFYSIPYFLLIRCAGKLANWCKWPWSDIRGCDNQVLKWRMTNEMLQLIYVEYLLHFVHLVCRLKLQQKCWVKCQKNLSNGQRKLFLWNKYLF